ncbi:MAG: hypothetical protein NTX33_18315, partial [Propionibacteriales bacterium]|nr:hypothetical protein [Propionibacteriales bacterium]
MAGENLARLRQWTNGMDADDVNEARGAWRKGAKSLSDVQNTLATAAEKMPKGFGEGASVSESAASAFTTVAERLSDQETRMSQAAEVLLEVHTAMTQAQTAAAGAPDKPADQAPRADDFPGLPLVPNLPFAIATANYNNDVAAYNSADADAEKKIVALNETYAKAIDVMKDIHGDPYVEVPDQDPVDPGPGPRPKNPGDPRDPTDDDDNDDDDEDDDKDDDDQDDDQYDDDDDQDDDDD